MGTFSKEFLLMREQKESEFTNMQTVHFIRENGRMINTMDRVDYSIIQGLFTKDGLRTG